MANLPERKRARHSITPKVVTEQDMARHLRQKNRSPTRNAELLLTGVVWQRLHANQVNSSPRRYVLLQTLENLILWYVRAVRIGCC